ncbi:MAG: MFS transporter [bacterium]|nr:MFS transporter [bacterium]
MMRFVSIFAAVFFLSIHYGVILYVHSSFLSDFFESNAVSLLFLLGAIGNVLIFLHAPKLIKSLGKRIFLFLSLILVLISSVFMALASTALTVAISSIIYSCLIPMTYYCLDIFLEELSTDKKTGEIRGLYLTTISMGVALGPLILAFLATMWEGFRPAYTVAALFLIPPILLSIFSLKSKTSQSHGSYHHSLELPYGAWWQSKNIRSVTLARLILEFFFCLMIIYTPIFLYRVLGFEWSELGIIFAVMLLPFILFDWLGGELADRFWGEKELLTLGFLITGFSLLVMPFIGKVFLAWMVILFISRVGASLVETMTETYFFKHVKAEDTGFLSIFRLTRSVGNILGIIVGLLTLNFFSFEKIFLVLAVVVFLGLKESLSLKDTL